MSVDIISRSISIKVMWLSWELNSPTLDLQSDMLLTVLESLAYLNAVWFFWIQFGSFECNLILLNAIWLFDYFE